MVTAETAVVLPALALVLAAAFWLLTAAMAQLECIDAARGGVRAAARDEQPAAVRAAVVDAAPDGARVTVRRTGKRVVVTVRTSVAPLGGWAGRVVAVPVHASATAAREDGASGTGDARR
jgi:hypothetical protein